MCLCVPFVRRSRNFFSKNFPSLFLFFVLIVQGETKQIIHNVSCFFNIHTSECSFLTCFSPSVFYWIYPNFSIYLCNWTYCIEALSTECNAFQSDTKFTKTFFAFILSWFTTNCALARCWNNWNLCQHQSQQVTARLSNSHSQLTVFDYVSNIEELGWQNARIHLEGFAKPWHLNN